MLITGRARLTCVGKDDVSDGFEASVQVRLHNYVHFPSTRSFHTNANHSDHHGRQDGDETRNSHIANLLQRPWQREDQAQNHAHNAEGNGASSVRGDRIHHDGECEDMAAHGKD